jgi:hypothetical protein
MIWNINLAAVIFGVALLVVAWPILKIAKSERSKRMGILVIVLVLAGISLIVLGWVQLLRQPCATYFGQCFN